MYYQTDSVNSAIILSGLKSRGKESYKYPYIYKVLGNCEVPDTENKKGNACQSGSLMRHVTTHERERYGIPFLFRSLHEERLRPTTKVELKECVIRGVGRLTNCFITGSNLCVPSLKLKLSCFFMHIASITLSFL